MTGLPTEYVIGLTFVLFALLRRLRLDREAAAAAKRGQALAWFPYKG